MRLYHGSRVAGLTEILPISATGTRGPTDPDRVAFRDVVFLATSYESARRYAGAAGSVYLVEAPGAVLYIDEYERRQPAHKSACQRAKKLRRLRAREGASTYVAPMARVLEEMS